MICNHNSFLRLLATLVKVEARRVDGGLGLRFGLCVLLLLLDLLHFYDRDSALAVNPLALDNVALFYRHHCCYAINVKVSDEAEAPWLLGAFILKNNTVL